jgi:hypothetical protein
MRRFTALTASAVACAVAAAPAAASPPERFSDVIVQAEPVPAFACADGSLVLQTFTLRRTVTTVTDREDGSLLSRVRQVRIDGTYLREDGARTLPYEARFRRAEDFVAGTNTLTGRIATVRDGEVHAARVGREVQDLATGEILQSAGRSIADFEADVCAALA